MTVKPPSRVIRSLAGYRPAQLAYWLIRRVQSRFPARVPDPGVAWREPSLHALRTALREWGPGDADARRQRADRWLAGELVLHRRSLDAAPDQWDSLDDGLLAYRVHYLDILVDLAWTADLSGRREYTKAALELWRSWVALGRGRGVGWDPYPTSLRAVNWVYATALLHDRLSVDTRAWLARELGAQLGWLAKRLEYHVMANHLQRNFRALAIGGLCLAGAAGARWRQLGLQGLWTELDRQVLPDGGHFERSPMYHLVFLADYLEVLALLRHLGEEIPTQARERVASLAGAGFHFIRPDDRLHLFGDSVNGEVPPLDWLVPAVARELRHESTEPDGDWSLPATGYWGTYRRTAGTRLIIDAGPFGAAYQPAHGHCDALSYELDVHHQPCLVDSGVAGYAGDRLREYVRSTRAHNTVTVDDQEQSEVWGVFRVARRAEVHLAEPSREGGMYRFRAACQWAGGRVVHERAVAWDGNKLMVRDCVRGAVGRRVVSWLHFDPAFAGEQDHESGDWVVSSPKVVVRVRPTGATGMVSVRGQDDPADGWHCPRFGCADPSLAIGVVVDPYGGHELGYDLTVMEIRL